MILLINNIDGLWVIVHMSYAEDPRPDPCHCYVMFV